MKKRGGHEMRKFLLYVSALVVVLIVAVIIYTTIDSINRINQEAEREKQSVQEALVSYLAVSAEASAGLARDPIISRVFSEEMTSSFARGDMSMISQFLAAILRPLYDAEYTAVVVDGEVAAASVAKGLDFGDFPTRMPGEGDEVTYEVLDSLGGMEGYYISFYRPFTMPGVDGFLNFVVDRTEQIEAIDAKYDQERSDLITRQIIIGVVAILAALLLTLLGVRVLTRRYITGPIEELADTSHRLIEGTFDGEIKVVEDSDYVDIQRLLQSGKVLIEKMEEVESDQ